MFISNVGAEEVVIDSSCGVDGENDEASGRLEIENGLPELEDKNSMEIVDITENDLTFQSSEWFNGAAYENYCWSQSVTDIGGFHNRKNIFETLLNDYSFFSRYFNSSS